MFKGKKNKKKSEKHTLTVLDVGAVFLRTLKLMIDFAYVIILLFVMLGTGMAFGYLASQIDTVKVPSKDSLVSQVSSLTRISQLAYSDGSAIGQIDSDLLRTPVASTNVLIISNMLLLPQKMKILSITKEWFQRQFFVLR